MEAPDGLIGEFLKCPRCNTRQQVPEPRELKRVATESAPSSKPPTPIERPAHQEIIETVAQPTEITRRPAGSSKGSNRLRAIVFSVAASLVLTGMVVTLAIQAIIPDPSAIPAPGASQAVVQRHAEYVARKHLESVIYDPDALEIVKFGHASRRGEVINLDVEYRGKNLFGAMLLKTANVTIMDGRVIWWDEG